MTKVLFKNETEYSPEVYENFLRFHEKKYGQKQRFKMIIFIILIMYGMIINIKYKNIVAAIVFLIASIIYIVYKTVYQNKMVEKEFKSDKIVKHQIYTFIFYHNCFKIKCQNEIEDIKYYINIHRINENKRYIYIYMDETHSYLLDKQGFIQGNIEEFKKFMKKKCFYKYSYSQ